MSDVLAMQRRRIDHIVVRTGKAPTVLDVPPELWEPLLEQVEHIPRYMNPPPSWQVNSFEKTPVTQIELFGVRFCKGRHED